MPHLISPDYGQQFLLPPALEDWVSADHPARFLREFVDQLDLPALGFVIPTGEEGRPAYAPGLLLKIWLYGYFQRIRSTRKLELACAEQLPLVWLAGMHRPDHNTLWRFWRDNQKALRGVFKQTVQLALRTGAVGLAAQALDGTKIAAAASGYSGWSRDYMEKLLAALDLALDQTELRIVAENAGPEASDCKLPAGLAERKALREQIKAGLAQLKSDERRHYHPVEPEARRMKVGDTNRYAYNAQAVADAQEGIVVACEVTRSESDDGHLVAMIEQARANTGAAPLTLADTGYGAGADLQAAEESGLEVLAPPREGPPPKNAYPARMFAWDASRREVRCPQNRLLDHEGRTEKNGVMVERFRCHHRDCPVRALCTKDPKGRQIEVWPHTPVVRRMRERLAQVGGRTRWRRRGEIIERCFAQVKQHDGFRRWTVWGLDGVRTQWSLVCATLNLRTLFARWSRKRTPAVAVAVKKGWAGVEKAVRHGWQALQVWLAVRRTGSTASFHRRCWTGKTRLSPANSEIFEF